MGHNICRRALSRLALSGQEFRGARRMLPELPPPRPSNLNTMDQYCSCGKLSMGTKWNCNVSTYSHTIRPGRMPGQSNHQWTIMSIICRPIAIIGNQSRRDITTQRIQIQLGEILGIACIRSRLGGGRVRNVRWA